MSKRASERVESVESAKRQSIEPSAVSDVPVQFAPLPQDGILPYDDTKAIRVDFNVLEYIRSETDLLITPTMKRIYDDLQKDDSPFTVLLQGASGVGKTMTLLFVGHMARKSGCIVFPIQGKDFVNQERPLSEIVKKFLSKWISAVGEQLLAELPCKFRNFSNLLEFVKKGLESDENDLIGCFEHLVQELTGVVDVPVLFLIDQYNAFLLKHTVKILPNDKKIIVEPGSGENPIASLFSQWDTFRMRRGCILYAFSSCFNLLPIPSDGSSVLFETLQPMDQSEFRRLIESSVNSMHLPHELLGPQSFQQLFDLCSGIPRELLAFSLAWKSSQEYNFDILKSIYLHNRRKSYLDRIKTLLNKEKMENELFKENVLFAYRVFVGRLMDRVPQIWKHAGLITFKNMKYQLLCPAAYDALMTLIDQDMMRDAVSILSSSLNTNWRALELGVVYVFRQAIVSRDPVVLECTKLDGRRSTTLYLKVKNIVHSETRSLVSSLPPGTMFVCTIRYPVIDFFIHDIDGQKVALKVFESSYTYHKSIYPGFEKMKEDYESAVINGNLSEIKCVYLTTSSHKMMRTEKHFSEQVLLISNINNGASKFFKGLI